MRTPINMQNEISRFCPFKEATQCRANLHFDSYRNRDEGWPYQKLRLGVSDPMHAALLPTFLATGTMWIRWEISAGAASRQDSFYDFIPVADFPA